jgi:uncharacterized protein (DUF2267 family)
MNIKILTKEESIEYWEKEKADRRCWTLEQIIEDAKKMMGMPDMGNTKYILSKYYEVFYEWIKTNEAIEQWNELPKIEHLARYWASNYQHQLETFND